MSPKSVKSRPGGPRVAVRPKKPTPGAAANRAAPERSGPGGEAVSGRPGRPGRVLSRQWLTGTAAPAAAAGVIAAVVAMQEGADLPIALVVVVTITGAIIGMISLKRGLYGG
jgi:hypothetical protein